MKELHLIDVMGMFSTIFKDKEENKCNKSKTQTKDAWQDICVKITYYLLKRITVSHTLQGCKECIITGCIEGKNNFRKMICSDYKATRKPKTAALLESMHWLPFMLSAFNINIAYHDGYEADDIIASLATDSKNDKTIDKVVIHARDKDYNQLLDYRTEICRGWQKSKTTDKCYVKHVTEESFKITEQILPSQWIEFQMLAGDSTDNIKGVYLVGPVGARGLLRKYRKIDAIDPSELKEPIDKKQQTMDRILVTLVKELNLTHIPDRYKQFSFDFDKQKNKLEEFCSQKTLEFLEKRIKGDKGDIS